MRALPALVVVMLGTASPVGAADSATEAAKVHVRSATAAYNLGNYLEAAREYEAGYKQTLDANLLFNIGQCYRLAGDRERAIIAYRSFIRSAPRSEQRSLAESKLRDLEQQGSPAPVPPQPAPAAPPLLAHATSSAPPVTPRVAPAAAPLATPPTPPGPSSGTTSVAPPPPAQPAGVAVAQSEPAQPVPSQQESHFYARWPFWTAVGVTVAGGVTLGLVLSQRGSTTPNMGNPSLGSKEY